MSSSIYKRLKKYVYIKRRNRRLIPAFLVLFIIIFYLSNSLLTIEHVESTAIPGNSINNCPDVSAIKRLQLFQMLNATSLILSKLHVSHFLCYNSLWAAAQEAGPFIWDANARLCALNSIGVEHDEPNLLRRFRRVGLDLHYSAADANYKVTNSSLDRQDAPHVMITVFEADPRLGKDLYRRVGWKRRLLPPNCDTYTTLECFPSFLVRSPMPRRTFGPLTLPAPHSDIDLLKYHFPDTWYKPVQVQC